MMSETVYRDYIPADAEIIVDYTAQEKVKFSYLKEWTYREAVWKNAFPSIFSLLFAITLYPVIVIFMVYYIALELNPHYASSTIISIKNLAIIGYFYLILLLVSINTTYILSLNKEKLSTIVPRIIYWGAMLFSFAKEKTYNPSDVQENRIIIPCFCNGFLNFDTTGDFRTCLDRIEILHIPFTFYEKGYFLRSRLKTKVHDYRAVFYFSRQPKTGSMIVEFY